MNTDYDYAGAQEFDALTIGYDRAHKTIFAYTPGYDGEAARLTAAEAQAAAAFLIALAERAEADLPVENA